MRVTDLLIRLNGKYRRRRAEGERRRPCSIASPKPVVSFSFDDVPKSACTLGGEILKEYGKRGTYFVSMSLMDSVYEIGAAFSKSDIERLVADGHEIGCHTYGHLDAWTTDPNIFGASIQTNQHRFNEVFPGRLLRTFSYPISPPHPRNKRIAGSRFTCCRGGGQTFNSKMIDLNHLKAYFIDQRNRDDHKQIYQMIEASNKHIGWLIFGTHDLEVNPSPYGCKPALFEDLLKYTLELGMEVLPVFEACKFLGISEESAIS